MNSEEGKVSNYIEKIVRDELHRLFQHDKSLCTCDNCLQDIITLTLNNLPAMYVSTEVGHIMTMYHLSKDQLQAQVLVEILKAIEKVKKNPRH